jgi:hypothetical protein
LHCFRTRARFLASLSRKSSHSRESGNPLLPAWTPAFAGVTTDFHLVGWAAGPWALGMTSTSQADTWGRRPIKQCLRHRGESACVKPIACHWPAATAAVGAALGAK